MSRVRIVHRATLQDSNNLSEHSNKAFESPKFPCSQAKNIACRNSRHPSFAIPNFRSTEDVLMIHLSSVECSSPAVTDLACSPMPRVDGNKMAFARSRFCQSTSVTSFAVVWWINKTGLTDSMTLASVANPISRRMIEKFDNNSCCSGKVF